MSSSPPSLSSSSLLKAAATAAVMSSPSNWNSDEPQWLIQIRRNLEEEHEDDDNDTVCIFHVPKTLMSYKPETYIPQQVALGPYHYKRPELYASGRHKVAAAKRAQKQLNNNPSCPKFEHLVHNYLTKLEPKIRSCYHGYLDFKPNTLAWIVAVDASFVLEFLQICAIREGVSTDLLLSISVSSSTTTSSSYLFPHTSGSGRKSAQNVILRDIMMLENQLPLFLLRKMLEIQYSSLETADNVLRSMLIGLFKEVSPIKMTDEYFLSINQVAHCAHLLDFLYHMLVPPKQQEEEDDEINEFDEENDRASMDDNSKESFGNTSHVKQLFNEVWNSISKLNRGPMHTLKKVMISKPVALVAKLPWTIITHLPGFALLKKPIENLIFSHKDKEQIKPENNDDHHLKPPLMEEINIPSVAELYKSGVRFLPITNGNIEMIRFDEKMATLHLPILCLDVNSDVVLRNLVAYEASIASGQLVFTRFTELMNGIIDTEEDAKLLREGGIVLNHLKTDEEVASLWNGMSRSVRLTNVPFLDKMIEDVNKYYSRRWRVKLKKFMKIYVFGSWQFLTFLAAILLLLMTTLQAFCSIYSCARIFRIPVVELTQQP
ncbi:Protein of unknown function DUF247 [Macleaya cordata]|uniref:Uncharacterized protein n=1 Tax=Macleaya cordata TaxID=56857 RepID=A0A200QPY4_MACCD|nr:Protein of unknown function DUF247 [Macleaya cordata]